MAGNINIPIELFPLFKIEDNSGKILDLLNQVIDTPLQVQSLITIEDKSDPLRLFITDLVNKVKILENRIITLESA